MICSHCGTPLPAGALFCGECGRPVAARAESAASTRVTPTESASNAMPAPEELVAPADPPVNTGGWSLDLPEREVADAAEPAHEPAPEPSASVEPSVVETSVVEPSVVEPSVVDSLPPLPDEPVTEEPRGAGWCAQCGALMSASDIFCGECGFVRQLDRRPRDTEVLDPFPWGIDPSSAGARAAEPPPAVASPVRSEADSVPPEHDDAAADVDVVDEGEPDDAVDDFEDTRIVAPGARGDRFVLQFSTGESVSVTGSGLLGRNPVAEPGEYFDALVTISDPGRSVSKTHLEFGQEGGSFWVSDRYSGNGTVVREPERAARRCDPGKRYRIVRGTRVDIGEQFFIVS